MSIDMFPESFIKYMKETVVETCRICGTEIKTQIQKNTGLCGDLCRKKSIGELPSESAQVDAGVTNLLNQPTGEVNLKDIQ